MNTLRDAYRRFEISPPEMHWVLGSGYGAVFQNQAARSGWIKRGEIPFSELPGVPSATAPEHQSKTLYFFHQKSGKSLAVQLGRLHGYEGYTAAQVARPLVLAAAAGTKRFILTNAAGSLKLGYPVGSILLLKDHVNLTGQNPLLGPNPAAADGTPLGPRFPNLAGMYAPELRAKLHKHFSKGGLTVNEGTYLGVLGPSFETPAEIQLFAQWGMDAVGMSTVWEAIALKHLGAEIAGISLLSNFGCGMSETPLDHDQVLKVSRSSAEKILQSLFEFAEQEFHARS